MITLPLMLTLSENIRYQMLSMNPILEFHFGKATNYILSTNNGNMTTKM